MNRILSTLAVASAVVSAVPPEQCAEVGMTLKDGTDMRGDANADYYLVAMLYAW